jgi:kinesin family member 5
VRVKNKLEPLVSNKLTLAYIFLLGKTLEEAKKINQSLSQLGLIITQLSSNSSFISYRSSKLTRLLQQSLGGNSLTSLILTLSPSLLNDLETLSTLRFGDRAMRVVNRAKINRLLTVEELKLIVLAKDKVIKALEDRVKDLEASHNNQEHLL